MDTKTPLKHQFYVKTGNHRNSVIVTTAEDGEVLSIENGKALESLLHATPQTAINIASSRVAGIRRVENADGSITPIPSDKVKTDIRLFVDSAPCWFPECVALRAAYNSELNALPTDCPACEKGALIRKYLKKMEAINTDPT